MCYHFFFFFFLSVFIYFFNRSYCSACVCILYISVTPPSVVPSSTPPTVFRLYHTHDNEFIKIFISLNQRIHQDLHQSFCVIICFEEIPHNDASVFPRRYELPLLYFIYKIWISCYLLHVRTLVEKVIFLQHCVLS